MAVYQQPTQDRPNQWRQQGEGGPPATIILANPVPQSEPDGQHGAPYQVGQQTTLMLQRYLSNIGDLSAIAPDVSEPPQRTGHHRAPGQEPERSTTLRHQRCGRQYEKPAPEKRAVALPDHR